MTPAITIVNRHYPPNKDITGDNAWLLVQQLMANNIDCHVVHIDRKYIGSGAEKEAIGNIHKVKTIYTGTNKYLKYLAGLWDGFFLIRKAKSLNKGPIIVMTSPPLPPLWASLMLKSKTWILWSMDLFPEGYAANKTLNQASKLYQWLLKFAYKNRPSKLISLGENQKKLLEKKYGFDIESVIIPCGVSDDNLQKGALPHWYEEDGILLGYLGNCGMPHNPAFIKAMIDAINPMKHKLILVLYGIHAKKLIHYAKNKAGVLLIDNVKREELTYIDVHMVTLLPSWTHVAVPSKSVSSICAGSTMLFCGNEESDIWQLLGKAGWHIEDNAAMKDNIRLWIENLTEDQIVEKRKIASKVSGELTDLVHESYNKIGKWAF